MNKISLSPTGKLFIIILVVVGVILTVVTVANSGNKKTPLYGNCTEYKLHDIHDIPRSSPYYAPSLDRDDDGIACESYVP